MGSESGEGNTQHHQGPSRSPEYQVSQTIEMSLQFVLPTISYLVNNHLPQVRELIFVLDDDEDDDDDDDEVEFQQALEASSPAEQLGKLSFKVKRGNYDP